MESSMNIGIVLTNSLSPDASLRNAAEAALTEAAGADFARYLVMLVTELANESGSGPVRAAAGIALKNAFTAREFARQALLQSKWLNEIDPESKARVRQLSLQTLASPNAQAGQAAAQVVAAVAAVELPRNQWPDLMPALVRNVSEGDAHQRQASLAAIGFICESPDQDVRGSLVGHANAILTAVVQGARKEEPSDEVRLAAITALGDSLEFVANNFRHEGERNYIMQVVCEATQAADTRIQQGAFGCLNRIMALYYDDMRFYMEKALFGLTILGMRSSDEDVAKLAVEFWSTVCEEEIALEDDNAMVDSTEQMRPFHNFSRVAAAEVVPVLLGLLLRQDEDAPDDEYNVARAAYQCLQLYAQAVGAVVVPPVIQFVEAHLRDEDWRGRDAAVSAFGAIMDGPDEKVLAPIVQSGMRPLIAMMSDPSPHVRDSTAYALGRVSEACASAIDPAQHLEPLVGAMFAALMNSPRATASSCWALMNLAERFGGEPGTLHSPLTPYFRHSVADLLTVTGQLDREPGVRTAAYEVLTAFVQYSADESLAAVAELADVTIKRLEDTLPMQRQVVSVEDRIALEDMQTSLCAVMQAVVQRLDRDVAPRGDRVMQVLLQLLTATAATKSGVPEAVFAAVGSLATALEESFAKYVDALAPFLFDALGNEDEPGLCAMAIGLVSDITRALGARSQQYCDSFMNYLLNNLRSTSLANQFKPAILQCFGDIATAIGGAFETYLTVVAQVLQQAAGVTAGVEASYDMFDYVVSLREGIMDAWGGIIGAMKTSDKIQLLRPYLPVIFELLNIIANDMNRSEALMRASMGVIGDLADAFPRGELSDVLRQDWLTALIKETRTNREFQDRTIDTARWAREQVKRHISGPQTAVRDS